jgi:predicted AlkP superfamily phosphohydrolase/phosphomutase
MKAAIQELEGPEGRTVVDRVADAEAVFDGDHDDIAPDLVAVPNDGFDLKAGFSGHDAVFDVGPRNGMHTFANASLFIDDPEADINGADLYDVAPTLLSLLEIDYEAAAMDGSALV